jgi:hypothetical protein
MLWSILARTLARPMVADWLIQKAQKRPYSHIRLKGALYMERYWLFNPYPTGDDEKRWWKTLLPSIRVHCIRMPDPDLHLHDHPWNVRTFILRSWYREEREVQDCPARCRTHFYFRTQGTTASLKFGEFHRIVGVPDDGVWTLFITWKKRGTWGFKVDDKKVPWREYLGIKGETNE